MNQIDIAMYVITGLVAFLVAYLIYQHKIKKIKRKYEKEVKNNGDKHRSDSTTDSNDSSPGNGGDEKIKGRDSEIKQSDINSGPTGSNGKLENISPESSNKNNKSGRNTKGGIELSKFTPI